MLLTLTDQAFVDFSQKITFLVFLMNTQEVTLEVHCFQERVPFLFIELALHRQFAKK